MCVCRLGEGREMFSLVWPFNCSFANGDIFLFQIFLVCEEFSLQIFVCFA